jgi:hypothetical protein
VFENRILRKIFGTKGDVSEEWGKYITRKFIK